MKKIFLLLTLVFSFEVPADDHLPANYSMYQTNFLFDCPEPEQCFAAFDKYMSAPEVAAENYEVDFFAVQQNGWDDSTHGISWYFLDEDQYAKSGLIFTTSQAGRDFRKTMNEIGAEIISDTLTVHSVGVTIAGEAATNVVTLRWSHEMPILPSSFRYGVNLQKVLKDMIGLQMHMDCNLTYWATMEMELRTRYGHHLAPRRTH